MIVDMKRDETVFIPASDENETPKYLTVDEERAKGILNIEWQCFKPTHEQISQLHIITLNVA